MAEPGDVLLTRTVWDLVVDRSASVEDRRPITRAGSKVEVLALTSSEPVPHDPS
jgi:hypothetical protein